MKTIEIKQDETDTMTMRKTQDLILMVYIFCYFLINLSFLVDFPFVHSDEAWLSGLSRNMMESSNPGVTETFYDLKPRYPHAIKILFHLLQIVMIALFQYRIFTFRLLSLIFGCIALILFYLTLKFIFCKPGKNAAVIPCEDVSAAHLKVYPLAGTILLSADIQFIYASHFARQEILLVCCMIACLLAILKQRPLIAGLITGLSIGLHPNSFLVGMMCAAMLFPARSGGQTLPAFAEKRDRFTHWMPLLGYTGITSIFATFFVALSLTFDKEFFRHYLAYGNSEFDIGAPVTDKLMEFPYFLLKIWHGVSGTYYIPDVRFEFILFGLTAMSLLAALIAVKIGIGRVFDFSRITGVLHGAEMALIGRGIAGLLAGMVLIGRYNQTSIVFLFPLFFLLILLAVSALSRSFVIFALTIAIVLSSITQITPWLSFHYADYTGEIAKVVKPENKVLANLNSEYYFENDRLFDYRNLSFLKEAGMSVEEYIKKNQIEYIILSDEMDLIYAQRPLWNMIYGNPRYMEELHRFLDENCTLRHQFKNNVYGIRIVQYINSDRDFSVNIFKVNDFS